MRFSWVCKINTSTPIVSSCCQGYNKLMDGLLPENMKQSIKWLALVDYMHEGKQGDHNIQFRKNGDHQEDQRVPFHTQDSGE